MTSKRGRGRPALTDDQAWWSLRKRFYPNVEEVEATGCIRHFGPVTYEIAGGRGVISPTNFTLAEIGKDLRWYTVGGRTCETRLCLNPDHWLVVKYESLNPNASWHPRPIPGESPEEKIARELAEAKAKGRIIPA